MARSRAVSRRTTGAGRRADGVDLDRRLNSPGRARLDATAWAARARSKPCQGLVVDPRRPSGDGVMMARLVRATLMSQTHVMPDEDLDSHDESAFCWCQPLLVYVDEASSLLILHRQESWCPLQPVVQVH